MVVVVVVVVGSEYFLDLTIPLNLFLNRCEYFWIDHGVDIIGRHDYEYDLIE